jgi:hypothetical protein
MTGILRCRPSYPRLRPALVTAAGDRACLRFLEFFAARRHLFDWLVTGQVVPVNPAASVRGPRHQGTAVFPVRRLHGTGPHPQGPPMRLPGA